MIPDHPDTRLSRPRVGRQAPEQTCLLQETA